MDLAYVWYFGDKSSKRLRHFTWQKVESLVERISKADFEGGVCSESTTFSSTTWQCLAESSAFRIQLELKLAGGDAQAWCGLSWAGWD